MNTKVFTNTVNQIKRDHDKINDRVHALERELTTYFKDSNLHKMTIQDFKGDIIVYATEPGDEVARYESSIFRVIETIKATGQFTIYDMDDSSLMPF